MKNTKSQSFNETKCGSTYHKEHPGGLKRSTGGNENGSLGFIWQSPSILTFFPFHIKAPASVFCLAEAGGGQPPLGLLRMLPLKFRSIN